MARGAQSGRIHVHQRNTDDVSELINANMAITAEHAYEINATTNKEMDDKTRREYRNRIRHIYRWWMQHYPMYFENGTRVLTEQDKSDQVKFHHTNDRDIIYTGLNVSLVMAFLSDKKKKSVKQHVVSSRVVQVPRGRHTIYWMEEVAGWGNPH